MDRFPGPRPRYKRFGIENQPVRATLGLLIFSRRPACMLLLEQAADHLAMMATCGMNVRSAKGSSCTALPGRQAPAASKINHSLPGMLHAGQQHHEHVLCGMRKKRGRRELDCMHIFKLIAWTGRRGIKTHQALQVVGIFSQNCLVRHVGWYGCQPVKRNAQHGYSAAQPAHQPSQLRHLCIACCKLQAAHSCMELSEAALQLPGAAAL